MKQPRLRSRDLGAFFWYSVLAVFWGGDAIRQQVVAVIKT